MNIKSKEFAEEKSKGIWRFRNNSWYKGRPITKWTRHILLNCRYCNEKFLTQNEDPCCSKSCGRKLYWKNLSFKKRYKRPRFKNEHGYIMVRLKNGKRMLEHRYIMGLFIKRDLKKSEHVHHINGKRADNRPENLMILSASGHNVIHKPAQSKNWGRDKIGKFVKKHINETH